MKQSEIATVYTASREFLGAAQRTSPQRITDRIAPKWHQQEPSKHSARPRWHSGAAESNARGENLARQEILWPEASDCVCSASCRRRKTCGTGRNFPWLVAAVGPTGEVLGVDCCDAMLAKAAELRERNQWRNVKLTQQDASEIVLPGQVDGVLFSLSYTVISKPRLALAQAWKYLRPGRHLVIMDGKLARGTLGRLSRPLVILASKATVLGDPDRRPWEDLKELTPQIEMEEVNLGTYYICRGTSQL